jgi:catechol 2,3-dioxygenase-like lactoylglutathione lyase family enzyme
MTAVSPNQVGSGPGILGILHPAQLFHVGIVAEDIEAAKAEISANLGMTWRGKTEMRDLILYGQERTVELQVAFSVQGPPHVEIIQSIPDSPWSATSSGVHHLCYWAEDSVDVCLRLEEAGNRRILGPTGAPSGYFQSPSGNMGGL